MPAKFSRSTPIGLPWFELEDYAELRALFTDGHLLPETFEQWLARAMAAEDVFRQQQLKVSRVLILPEPFCRWCRQRNCAPGHKARQLFADELAGGTLIQR